jgi:hypothetical protein
VYRPGSLNKSADALSRAYSATSIAFHSDTLRKLHVDLFHPGVERLTHFIKQKNLPYSVDDVKRVVSNCNECARTKPRFFNAKTNNHLIKALHPMDRLVCDFKGPVKSTTPNRFLFVVVDEYSRFTWAFPCRNIDTQTVIKCFTSIFSVFGMPNYVHNDQGRSLISSQLKEFLHGHGIATSQTTRFNPRGNSQCERFNGILWQSIIATLRSLKLSDAQWETVLQDALHAQRSLLCTATNCTPHERMFTYPRKSSSGCSLPSWLKPGPILVKRHVRNKGDPLVDDAELLEVNPAYGKVRLENGREINVSLRDLAPTPKGSHNDSDEIQILPTENLEINNNSAETETNNLIENGDPDVNETSTFELINDQTSRNNPQSINQSLPPAVELRRSNRHHVPVYKFGT